ncbi:MAG: SDR family NAD(P)-dependent oxidoreductase [Actinobacteria bacterium]|nr:SDR family NAD(P)-dependent oxidoreductase [Actinomycetota bacterium]
MSALGRAVLITGCSSGIGRATAERLARRGWSVYATARDLASIHTLEGPNCRPLRMDVTEPDSIREAVTAVEDAAGAVGALINNAGYSQSGAVEDVPMDLVRTQFETNFFGPLGLIQAVLPGMRRAGWGKIVNMSSMGGKLTFPGGGLYHASKHAIEALSDALRFEVRRFGVDVIVVEPGIIRTGFASAAASSVPAGTPSDGPYDDFNSAVAVATQMVYERGTLRRLGAGPTAVARVVERALEAKHPRARYPVTPSARLLMTARKIMPDGAWDAFLRRQFPQPGPH